MSPDFDPRKAAHTRAQRIALVRAIVSGAMGAIEADWLEWKSEAPVGKGLGALVAKHVLGFANRQPIAAARSAGGWAYLIVGAEEGSIRGMVKVDPAKLEDSVARILGPKGPDWIPDYLTVDEKTVLLVAVPPPEQGDPRYYAHKVYQPAGRDDAQQAIEDGDTFIRRHGKTTRANSAEHAALDERARGAAPAGIDIRSSAHPLAWRAVQFDRTWLDHLVEVEEERLMQPLRGWEEGERGLADLVRIKPIAFDPFRERRDPEEYTQEVKEYLGELRERYGPELARRAMQVPVAALELEVVNRTDQNYHSLEVVLDIAARMGAEWLYEVEGSNSYLPKPPAKWERGLGRSILDGLSFSSVPFDFSSQIPSLDPGGSIVVRPGGLQVRYPPIDLRPEVTYQLDALRFAVPADQAGKPIKIAWSATAKNQRGKPSGTMRAQVQPEVIEARELLPTLEMKDPD